MKFWSRLRLFWHPKYGRKINEPFCWIDDMSNCAQGIAQPGRQRLPPGWLDIDDIPNCDRCSSEYETFLHLLYGGVVGLRLRSYCKSSDCWGTKKRWHVVVRIRSVTHQCWWRYVQPRLEVDLHHRRYRNYCCRLDCAILLGWMWVPYAPKLTFDWRNIVPEKVRFLTDRQKHIAITRVSMEKSGKQFEHATVKETLRMMWDWKLLI